MCDDSAMARRCETTQNHTTVSMAALRTERMFLSDLSLGFLIDPIFNAVPLTCCDYGTTLAYIESAFKSDADATLSTCIAKALDALCFAKAMARCVGDANPQRLDDLRQMSVLLREVEVRWCVACAEIGTDAPGAMSKTFGDVIQLHNGTKNCLVYVADAMRKPHIADKMKEVLKRHSPYEIIEIVERNFRCKPLRHALDVMVKAGMNIAMMMAYACNITQARAFRDVYVAASEARHVWMRLQQHPPYALDRARHVCVHCPRRDGERDYCIVARILFG